MRRGATSKTKPMQLASYVVLLLCAVAAMFALKHCSRPPAGAEKTAAASGGDTIDVAISYSPMTLYRYADTLGGFSYDLLRQLSASGKFPVKFHPMTSLEKSMAGLDEGVYDLVVADVARTTEIDSTRYVFTDDIYLDKQVLVQRRDSAGGVSVGTQLDLGGKHVWVESQSPAFWRLRNLSAEIGDTIFIESQAEYTSEQLFLLTAVGDIPMSVVNERVARIMAADYPDVDVSTAVSFTQFQAWMLRGNDAQLLSRINAAVSAYRGTAAYKSLAKRYGLADAASDKE